MLSTKVGYDVDGIADWTGGCVLAGVDAARDRLRTDVIDVVHLHSCVAAGKVRVAAYSGDGAALRYAVMSGAFDALQASVSLCDQQALPARVEARAAGLGTIAKRPLAGRPWHAAATASADTAHAEYRRRFAALRQEPGVAADDWEALALRFSAYEPGVDCVIVGGTDPRHLERNVDAVAAGPLEPARRAALREAFRRVGPLWQGLV